MEFYNNGLGIYLDCLAYCRSVVWLYGSSGAGSNRRNRVIKKTAYFFGFQKKYAVFL